MAEDNFSSDEMRKELGEVMRNETCKKILDVLREKGEASVSEIAREIGAPVNTADYNLKKLLRVGLVEESGKFYWSVKGKKVPTYKLSKRKIVLSPVPKSPGRNSTHLFLLFGILVLGAALILALFAYNSLLTGKPAPPSSGTSLDRGFVSSGQTLKTFASEEELEEFVKNRAGQGVAGGAYFEMGGAVAQAAGLFSSKSSALPPQAAAESAGGASTYSQTNIQVQGVDEPDIVKNDGKYIYVASGDVVSIVEAFPPEQMKVLATIDLRSDNQVSVRDLLLNDDKLIILGTKYVEGEEVCYEPSASADANVPPATLESESSALTGKVSAGSTPYVPWGGRYCYTPKLPRAVVFIYDISDKNSPELVKRFSVDGLYQEARMIGDFVYLIIRYSFNPRNIVMPAVAEDGVARELSARDVVYFDDYLGSFTLTTIAALSLDDLKMNTESFLLDTGSTIYVSKDNIYITAPDNAYFVQQRVRYMKEVYPQVLPDDVGEQIKQILNSDKPWWEKKREADRVFSDYVTGLEVSARNELLRELHKASSAYWQSVDNRERTLIHKISINGERIAYVGSGSVPGHLLNQFSMDEHNGYLRVATTAGEVWNGKSKNNVYVLDQNLEIVGSLEDLAQGEKIYSARFVGNRAYLVTFKKVDPFFVIDLSNPREPKVLGYLKIPGFSDYLHPYDENHIIGVGKDTIEASDELKAQRGLDFAWYQGVKVSLFDVSDVDHPKEIGKVVIGDRGSSTPLSYEHKAFLFDKEKGIIVLPVTVARIDRERYNGEIPPYASGLPVWRGVYVLNVDENGLSVRGKISHADTNEELPPTQDREAQARYNAGYRNLGPMIMRSLFMDDVLYTISDELIKASDLQTLDEINKIKIPSTRSRFSDGIYY